MNDSLAYNITLLISIVILLCFSAFFSACEMAFSSLSRIKIKKLAEKSRRARLALKMLDNYDKLLSTVLIGNNAVNIASSALAAAFFIGLFEGKGVGIATLVMTIILMLFCDISPKALAKETPEITALRSAPLLQFFIFILTPVNFITLKWKKLLMLIFPVKNDRSTTEDELLTFVKEVRQEGGINLQEEHMIRQVISFDELKVSGIFTPRADVAALSITASVDDIDRMFIKTGFSRLPVYEDTVDNIKGIIILKDFYCNVMKGLKTPAEIVKPVVFVTRSIKIEKLLRTMQQKQAYMAIVIDEHGGALGIVTIEDIVEELVGEIWDEHEKIIEPVKKLSDGSFRALGSVSFMDMLEFINNENSNDSDAVKAGSDIDKDSLSDDLSNPVSDNIEIPHTTVANWIMETLGRLPRTGEQLTWNHLTLTVSRIYRQRVLEVNVMSNNLLI